MLHEQIEIPFDALEHDTLNNLIEEYVSRNGTDYGEKEMNLLDKVNQIKELLCSGEVKIIYDELTQSTNIVPALPSPSC